MDCKRKTGGQAERAPRRKPSPAPRSTSSSREENLTTAEVLAKYTAGPKDGVFTDGAAEPNPGEGGWGAVYVVGDQVVAERDGHEPHTTNNRMELAALIAGVALVPAGTKATALYGQPALRQHHHRVGQGLGGTGLEAEERPHQEPRARAGALCHFQESARARPALDRRALPAIAGTSTRTRSPRPIAAPGADADARTSR